MDFQYSKIIVYVPESHAGLVRETLGKAGCGKIGNYDFCSFSTKGIGRFRPGADAKPFIGEAGKVEEAVEERIEVICEKEKIEEVVKKVKKVHPYEEVAIDIYPLLKHDA